MRERVSRFMPHAAARRRLAAACAAVALPIAVAALWPHRPLTAGEIAELRRVFGDSVDYAAVAVSRAPLPAPLTAFALAERVVFRRGYYLDDFSADRLRMSQLVHEVEHVRAHQAQGPIATWGAIVEHLRHGDRVYVQLGDGYERRARLAEERYLALAHAGAVRR